MDDNDEEVSLYDEVEIEDMTFDEALRMYHYPCPCGDKFEIYLGDLRDGTNDIAQCPSCSLMIRVIYEKVGASPMLAFWRSKKKTDYKEGRISMEGRTSIKTRF